MQSDASIISFCPKPANQKTQDKRCPWGTVGEREGPHMATKQFVRSVAKLTHCRIFQCDSRCSKVTPSALHARKGAAGFVMANGHRGFTNASCNDGTVNLDNDGEALQAKITTPPSLKQYWLEEMQKEAMALGIPPSAIPRLPDDTVGEEQIQLLLDKLRGIIASFVSSQL